MTKIAIQTVSVTLTTVASNLLVSGARVDLRCRAFEGFASVVGARFSTVYLGLDAPVWVDWQSWLAVVFSRLAGFSMPHLPPLVVDEPFFVHREGALLVAAVPVFEP